MAKWHKIAGGGVLAIALLAGVGGEAKADLITSWNYTLNNGFTSFSPTPGVVGSNNNPVLNAPTVLTWPESSVGELPGNTSSLTVESQVNGVVNTNGANAPGATLTHNNFETFFRPDEYLDDGILSVQLDLTPNTPPVAGPQGPFSATFDFKFRETFNAANNENCGFPSESNCDDLFLLVAAEGTVSQFTFDGFLYTVTLGAEALQPLDAATCALVNEGPGCIGFLTTENGSTPFPTFINITAEPIGVPEPGMLALLGTGLVALGAIRRRKAAE